MRTLNLGILAHVDAGKTSLTERLLFDAGVIPSVGKVDDGSTQTDSLALERQRGITIRSAVVSFVVADVTVNLIDTPGHPDFIAEVERVLSVLDGAVLVISAVEGVQAQTRVLLRTLRRLQIPVLIFVNKIDRAGARERELVDDISQKLAVEVVPMGSVTALGTRDADFRPGHDTRSLVESLAEHDDRLLAAYVGDRSLPAVSVRRALAQQTRRGLIHPVFFGSAITGAGVETLRTQLVELLPAVEGDDEAEASGVVFKIDRGASGEKIAYVRMFTGALRVRDRLSLRAGVEDKVVKVSVFEHGHDTQRDAVGAGRIAKVWGLASARIGDGIGAGFRVAAQAFAPPTLETVVVPGRRSDAGALHAALTQLAEQDPLIDFRRLGDRADIAVSLYGEVQKEVIGATLAADYGIEVAFRETTVVCVERVVGVGAAHEAKDEEDNPFLAGVGLRIAAGPVGSGVRYALAGEVLGTMPQAFFTAIEHTVHQALDQGLAGWQVTDCEVTLTHTGYFPRQSHTHASFDKSMSSTARDFRQLTPLVVMSALRQAGTRVCEPIHRFRLELPADVLAAVLSALPTFGAVPLETTAVRASYVVEGTVPAAQIHAMTTQIPGLTHGEGVLETEFDRYEPVSGPSPTRPRTDDNPLDRKEYLLRVSRRLGGL